MGQSKSRQKNVVRGNNISTTDLRGTHNANAHPFRLQYVFLVQHATFERSAHHLRQRTSQHFPRESHHVVLRWGIVSIIHRSVARMIITYYQVRTYLLIFVFFCFTHRTPEPTLSPTVSMLPTAFASVSMPPSTTPTLPQPTTGPTLVPTLGPVC